MTNIISYLQYNMNEFTISERTIAQYFLDKKNIEHLRIVDVSKDLYISTATISRFINKAGFKNYKSFLYELQKAYELEASAKHSLTQETSELWSIHQKFYKDLYTSISNVDFNYIANRILNSKNVFTFGFGKTHDIANMIIYRLESVSQNLRSIPHYEHLIYTVEQTMNHESLLLIFYQHDHFKKDLQKLIKLAKQKYIPIIIITISIPVETQNYATVYSIYPYKDDTVVKYSTTMYTPFLLFIDSLYLSMNKKRQSHNFNY